MRDLDEEYQQRNSPKQLELRSNELLELLSNEVRIVHPARWPEKPIQR